MESNRENDIYTDANTADVHTHAARAAVTVGTPADMCPSRARTGAFPRARKLAHAAARTDAQLPRAQTLNAWSRLAAPSHCRIDAAAAAAAARLGARDRARNASAQCFTVQLPLSTQRVRACLFRASARQGP